MNSMEGIQYLRQVNLREYEVVPANHAQATHIINQHGHIEQIKVQHVPPEFRPPAFSCLV